MRNKTTKSEENKPMIRTTIEIHIKAFTARKNV